MAEFEKDRENHRIQSLIAGGRWKAQLKQRALAEMIGVSQSSISDYETGRKKPTADTLLKICQVLKVSESKAEKALAMLK
jgi:transcriptional regulator with XRE-family HTH domain